MQWLARISILRPVFAAVLILLVVVLGGAAYGRLGLDYFPNVDLPIVVVTTTLPGAAAEEVESDITDKIEGAVNTVSGIDELRSTSSEGVSVVVVSFDVDKPIDAAAQDVRDKISQIMPDLPRGVDAPVVSKVDPGAAPVLYLALRSKRPVGRTTELADKIVRRQLESIEGVGEVALVGGRKRQINVALDGVAMRALGVNALEVQGALAAQNVDVPGGSLDTGPEGVNLRVAGRVKGVEEIGRIVVKQRDGRAVRVHDVARVEDGTEREASAASFDDEPAVVLLIKKQSGKNTVAVVDAVLARLPDVRATLPADVGLDVVYDNSGVIRTSTHAVLEHLVLGAALAAFVVLLFLGNGRSTLVAAVAIPVSIVGTFAVMYAFGFTLNFLTLLALALAVGLVIDDAIVVIENIVSFIEKRGLKPFPAAMLATKDIGLAVLATTLALMSVFIPIAFMGGIVGKFLKSFGLTMASAIGVSLFVSFTLTPMLGARVLKGHDPGAPPGRLRRAVDAFYRPIERAYVAALAFALRRRWVVVLASVAALATMGPVGRRLGGGFLPANDKAQFQITLRAPEGTSVAETNLFAERLAAGVRDLPGVEHLLITIGDDAQKTQNLATLRVLLADPGDREATQAELMDRARRELVAKLPPSLRVAVSEVPDFASGGSNAPISYALTGPDLAVLADLAGRVTAELRRAPGAVDVDSSLVDGKPELRATIDRDRAADLGVRVGDIAAALQLTVGGVKATTYAEGGEEYEVRVRADERFRTDPQMLPLVTVPSQRGVNVPLASAVSFSPAKGPAQIERLNRARQVTITAASTRDVGDSAVDAALRAAVDRSNLPAGYRLLPLGSTKEQAKMGRAFAFAFGASFVFMYLILAAQFESWLNPLIILLALPLTVPFGLISLLIFGQTINLFSMLGLLVLFGVVQKNAVLQIDHTSHLLAQGKPPREALLEANRDRLRPILMTTLAFVAGMLPLVFSRGVGAGFNQAMSGIVVGGQALSLVLTLLATPVFYSFALDAVAWVQRRRRPAGEPDPKGHQELLAMLHRPTQAPAE